MCSGDALSLAADSDGLVRCIFLRAKRQSLEGRCKLFCAPCVGIFEEVIPNDFVRFLRRLHDYVLLLSH